MAAASATTSATCRPSPPSTELAAAGVAVARVAVTDPESPPEVADAADVVVEGPAGAVELLERLAAPG